jgi:AraC-like DNA-binding protein
VSLEDNPSHRLGTLVSYLEQHYREDIRIADMCRMTNMSRAAFYREFSRIFRQSPQEYVDVVRIQHASMLLLKTDRPVSEIALDCGFSDSNYFSRRFHQKTGFSPMDYRRRFR